VINNNLLKIISMGKYSNLNSIEKEEQTTSKKRTWYRNIALIPVFIAAICVFSTKVIAQNNEMITHGKGVSQELLTEYQEIVSKYLEKYSPGNQGEIEKYYWKSDYLSEEDWTRLYVIYFQMNPEQKFEQIISFREPPRYIDRAFPPPQRWYDLWIENKKCKIWIDDEQIDKSALNSYEPTDFFRFFVGSILRSNGQKEEYRVDLWTEAGHKKFSEQFFKQPVSINRLLEIEPIIEFLVEKDGYKTSTLWFYAERDEWAMRKITDISENGMTAITEPSQSPSAFHPKPAAELYISNPGPLKKWKIGNNIINSSTLELHTGQSAVYDGDINKGSLKNFAFKAHITHSEGAKASFWIHSDANLAKGYAILIGKPVDDRRRSGSLASVRNLYKPRPFSFDIEVIVQGKRIVVRIDGSKVVDYLEPAAPYRTAANAAQLLSDGGLIGFHSEKGTLNVGNAEITTFADNLPNYPDGKKPIDEQDDTLIRLQQRNFPVIDYHVHWPIALGLEAAIEKSLADGFEYGIAANCGIGFQTTSDEQVKALFKNNFILPQLFYAMQGEGREWIEIFSKESREMFDYVFTDALTFNDHKGRRTHLWIDPEVIIDIPEQEYMDMIMDRTLKILNEEPIDFLASSTRLSAAMMKDYDKFWTDERISQLINALKKNNIALEINAVTKVPSAKIIKAAKAAGIKFTLGTNNNGVRELDRLDYSLRMVEECGLTIDDMWFPKGQ
jgi:hypothetical protein